MVSAGLFSVGFSIADEGCLAKPLPVCHGGTDSIIWARMIVVVTKLDAAIY